MKLTDEKRKALISWLESMPWWEELAYAKLEDMAEATNPWVASTAIQDQYQCQYCRTLIHGHRLPDRDMMAHHETDCIFLKALAKLENDK